MEFANTQLIDRVGALVTTIVPTALMWCIWLRPMVKLNEVVSRSEASKPWAKISVVPKALRGVLIGEKPKSFVQPTKLVVEPYLKTKIPVQNLK